MPSGSERRDLLLTPCSESWLTFEELEADEDEEEEKEEEYEDEDEEEEDELGWLIIAPAGAAAALANRMEGRVSGKVSATSEAFDDSKLDDDEAGAAPESGKLFLCLVDMVREGWKGRESQWRCRGLKGGGWTSGKLPPPKARLTLRGTSFKAKGPAPSGTAATEFVMSFSPALVRILATSSGAR
jgi:hypothetical protein